MIEKQSNTIEPVILWKGEISASQVLVSKIDQSESNRAINTNVEARLKENWAQKIKEDEAKGIVLYDGISYRLETFSFNDGILSIAISPINFSVRSTLKKMPELVELGESYYSHGLSVGGFVVTSDGKYIFARKSNKSASSLQQDIIGGVLENVNPVSGEGILNENLREIKEEINVDQAAINNMKIIGLVRSSTTDIVITTLTTLNISAAELKEIFEDRDDLELEGIDIVDHSDLDNYLEQLGGYKPIMRTLLT